MQMSQFQGKHSNTPTTPTPRKIPLADLFGGNEEAIRTLPSYTNQDTVRPVPHQDKKNPQASRPTLNDC
ncbi:unnamed protein product, partial [Brenthis ino]